MNISSQCMRSAWIVFMMVVMIAVLNISVLAHNKLSTIMSFKTNDSVFTIVLVGAVSLSLDLYDGVNGSSGWIFCWPTINCTQLWVSELTTSVFTILLMSAVFYPWIFMMVLMVQVVEYFSSTYLLAPVGWPTIMSLQNNDSVFTIMEIVALSLIIFALSISLSLFQVSDIQLHW